MRKEEAIKYDGKLPVAEKNTKQNTCRTHKPKINYKLCEKAYNCAVFCPVNAIAITKSGQVEINYDLCNGCLICLRQCPHGAITEEKE